MYCFNKFGIKIFGFVFLLLMLSACGGSDDELSQEDSEADTTPIPTYVNVSDVSARALVNTPNIIRANALSQISLEIKNLKQINHNDSCVVQEISGLSYTLQSDKVGECHYQYEVAPVSTAYSLTDDSTYIARSRVGFGDTHSDPNLPLLSATTFVGSEAQFDLTLLLGADFPEGYTLEDDVQVLGNDASITRNVTVINNKIYFQSGMPGVFRLFFSLTNGTNIKLGTLDIAVSYSNHDNPVAEDFYYTRDFAGGMPTPKNTIVHIDLSDKIYYPSYAQDPTLISLEATFNQNNMVSNIDSHGLSFDFESSTSGTNQIVYYVTDQLGGFAMGTVSIDIEIDAAGLQEWREINTQTTPVRTFTAPKSKVSADQMNLDYFSTFKEDGDKGPINAEVITMTFQQAQNYCLNNGMRLPMLDEMELLYSDSNSNVFNSQLWPASLPYWVNNRASISSVNTFDLFNGNVNDYPDTEAKYVTCIELSEDVRDFYTEISVDRSLNNALSNQVVTEVFQPNGTVAPFEKIRVETLGGKGTFDGVDTNSKIYQADASGIFEYNYTAEEYIPETILVSQSSLPINMRTILGSWSYDSSELQSILVPDNWQKQTVSGDNTYNIKGNQLPLVQPDMSDNIDDTIVYNYRQDLSGNIQGFYKIYHEGTSGTYGIYLHQPASFIMSNWTYNSVGIPQDTRAYGIVAEYRATGSPLYSIQNGRPLSPTATEIIGSDVNFVWFIFDANAKELKFYFSTYNSRPTTPQITISTPELVTGEPVRLGLSGFSAGRRDDKYIIQKLELNAR